MAILAGLASVAMAAETTPTQAVVAAFDKEIRPLLQTNCIKCHGQDGKKKGDVDFSLYVNGESALRGARKVWSETRDKLGSREMPPNKEKQQPSDAERTKIAAWVTALKALDPPDPGRVTARRLNRAEYNNTVRDLFGVDLKPAADFPIDDVGEGFDNIADVLSLSPLLLEKYLLAADAILDKAIVIEQMNMHWNGEQMPAIVDGKNVDGKPDGKQRELTVGESYTTVGFPKDAKYTIKIKAGADQAGTEPVRMAVKLDSQVIGEFKIMASKSSPSSNSISIAIGAGQHRLSAIIMNPFSEATAAAPAPAPDPTPAGGKKGAKAAAKPAAPAPPPPPAPPAGGKPPPPPKVRVLYVDAFDIQGPPSPPLTELHKRIMIAKPGKDLPRRDAAQQIIERFATRAFRQPANQDMMALLMKVFDLSDSQGEVFEESVKLALKAVLISPEFCFRNESDSKDADQRGIARISDYELASRLSYFLWSSMPDDELLDLAKDGKLHDPSTIDQQVRRMLHDPKSRALVDNFAGQWLQLRNLDVVTPDEQKFAEFDKPLRKAMYDEAALFFDAVMRDDRPILDFIDADYTFVNDRLAKHYGISGVTGAQMRKVQLPDHNRGGVLGMASILTITSNPGRTSPVKRGKWVLEEILGTPPPPPPPMVEALDKQDAAATAGLTLRQRMERHRTDPSCASCHVTMDAIGFGLENFDAIGRWRADENGLAMDTSGALPGGLAFKGPEELKKILSTRKQAFARCLTQKLLTYALGRGLKDYDESAVDKVVAALETNNYRFSTLAIEIARSYPFTFRRNLR